VPKNIVLLSDGTGNSAAKLFKTNVYRLYEALDRSNPQQQVAYYDDGIGTSSFRPLAALGSAFGFGLKRNVLDLYRFLCRNYEPGDRIFCFGFSRGAFTVRVLAGLIAQEGVVERGGNGSGKWDGRDEAELASQASIAYRAFRNQFQVTGGLVGPLRRVRDAVLRRIRPERDRVPVDSIQFVGVWDTVAAYGGPIEEITRGIDHWVWPLSMPDRMMSGKIQRACHAIALDDERNSFHPVLWDELCVHGENGELRPMDDGWAPPPGDLPEIDQQRLSQVWFSGMHSDVGGGYAQDGLSFKTLEWMMDRAEVYGLRFDPHARQLLLGRAAHFDKLNDSRKGVGGYYRYKPRRMSDLLAADVHKPKLGRDLARMARRMGRTAASNGNGRSPSELAPPMIHESAIARIDEGVDGYSPIVLPPRYRVVGRNGEIAERAHDDAWVQQQERVFNWVWARRVVYFLTLAASLYLLALPWIKDWPEPAKGASSHGAFLIPVIDAARHVLPELTSTWLDAFEAAPGKFGLGALSVLVWLWVGRALEGRITDEMRRGWHPDARDPQRSDPRGGHLYRVRTSPYYRGFFYALTHWVLPTAFAIAIYALPFLLIWHLMR
jgi:uncharacterized protein (DUF2235 family)